ncbi:MAG: dTDP-4-dehydrorhamnose reductase [Candidatus Hydrogenedentota bacterium]|nr:MAG: dTDP-4-dehydrorhamnose reductase [Candidatus Hydrogenedentota bacterium]
MKTLLIGADGQLGSDLRKAYPVDDLVPLTIADLDVCDYPEVDRIFREHSPDVVINTAAYHRVDECEDYPEKAMEVNALAVRNLAVVCKRIDAILVHFSTDYVFDGEASRPYTEADTPRPLSAYAISKLAGEHYIRYVHDKHFIIRLCGLYGVTGSMEKGTNFVETMLKLAKEGKDIKVVNDQTLTPTYTRALAPRIKALIETKQYGLYHMACEGACSWYDFARGIFELSGLKPNLSPTTSDVYRTPAKRPRYSVLENENLKSVPGVPPMPHWRDALKEYLEERKMSRGER